MGVHAAPTLITSVQRALRLMEAVGAHEGGVPAKRLARETRLPLATTYHLLRTLVHDGYLRRLDDGGFVIGDKLHTLESGSREQALLAGIRPTLTALRDELSAAAYLTFYDEGEIRVVDIVDGPHAPRVDLWVGYKDAGHATALGKCVLRELDDDARHDYLARHPLFGLTPRTVTRSDDLLRRLDSPTGSPLVADLEEYALGTVCFAVPISWGDRLGSLGVSLPVARLARLARLDPHRELFRTHLVPTANRVSRHLSLTI
ncbi:MULTISPECIES: IclR family transcriptional regulator [Streptomyces]|uniref:IclR family transcriptional regulator C-terminal domain-containing protein n=1 Tax=Streptomyces mordarskii TaxID=1226758 RepID=A0ABN1CI73_9ACTN|nr:IclR family transcriptional regulator C-terminal domain-containing protein [Streptomyces sp. AgN23]AJZ86322.1 helix-turn-helix domain-containing protein [Streptomyces sp. AgN23]